MAVVVGLNPNSGKILSELTARANEIKAMTFETCLRKVETDRVFVSTRGKKWSTRGINKDFRDFCLLLNDCFGKPVSTDGKNDYKKESFFKFEDGNVLNIVTDKRPLTQGFPPNCFIAVLSLDSERIADLIEKYPKRIPMHEYTRMIATREPGYETRNEKNPEKIYPYLDKMFSRDGAVEKMKNTALKAIAAEISVLVDALNKKKGEILNMGGEGAK